MYRRRGTLLLLAVILAGALTGAVAGEKTQAELTKADGFLDRYTSLLRLVIENTPLEVEASELVYSSLDSMLGTLDPHTHFMRPETFASMKERQQGSFHGIGVIISLRGGRVTVITPIEGTPAAKAGLRAGDIIETIDGTSTENLDLDEAARKLRGPEGTSVSITISRAGFSSNLDLTIKRARVPSDSIRYAFMLNKDTAYIRISDFIRTTGDEFNRNLENLQKEGATKLVLDLRDNPGGAVDSAVTVSGTLIEPGQPVFSTKGRTADSFQDYQASRDGLHFAGPLVVLVNRGSASAAEIVAGAIQDHDRGLVVGETSFGKGVVQTIYPTKNAAVALTTAKYYTPSGRCIQRDFDSFFDYIHPANADGARPLGVGEVEPPTTPQPTPSPNSPVFFTDAGRKVFGGGGITPDHHVSLGQYSDRLARLVGRSAFFQFAVAYLADKTDKAAAAHAYTVNDDVIKTLRQKVIEQKWLTEAEIDTALADPRDRRDIEIGLRAEILSVGASIKEGYRAYTESDDQVQAALKLFDEAAKLHARVKDRSSAKTASRR